MVISVHLYKGYRYINTQLLLLFRKIETKNKTKTRDQTTAEPDDELYVLNSRI